MIRIGTTENNFTAVFATGVTVQIEGEYWIRNQSLVDQIIEWRNHLIHRDWLVCQTENAIEFGCHENESRLTECFGEGLVFDVQATNLSRETIEKCKSFICHSQMKFN